VGLIRNHMSWPSMSRTLIGMVRSVLRIGGIEITSSKSRRTLPSGSVSALSTFGESIRDLGQVKRGRAE
jgi:hypothetical protein